MWSFRLYRACEPQGWSARCWTPISTNHCYVENHWFMWLCLTIPGSNRQNKLGYIKVYHRLSQTKAYLPIFLVGWSQVAHCWLVKTSNWRWRWMMFLENICLIIQIIHGWYMLIWLYIYMIRRYPHLCLVLAVYYLLGSPISIHFLSISMTM